MMSNVPQRYDDEIDLLSLMQTVWHGKWKIVSIIAGFLLLVFGFYIVIPDTTFTASTEIKPITSVEIDKYSLFNASLKVIRKEKEEKKEEKKNNKYSIFEITTKDLLNLYIEQIEEGSLLEKAIEKFNLINKDDYDSDNEYRGAIEKFASEIQVIRPAQKNNGRNSHYLLRAEYHDEDKWKDLLRFVNNEANREVKASIINRFATIVSIQNQTKDFAIKDIDLKIKNINKDYDRITKDRLAFLTEQAAIAKKLDIQKNTIASERFNAQNSFVTNVKTDAPFYLRGYLAISEEINQIKNRGDKKSFIKDLYDLERQKRDLEQDKTIERAIALFNKTPLNQNNFKASIVKVGTTDFFESNLKSLYYALAIVFGGIIGVIYVLIAKAFINRRNNIAS